MDPMLATGNSGIEAIHLLKTGKREKGIQLLNAYTNEWGNKVVNEAWRLGDQLWTKYDELF